MRIVQLATFYSPTSGGLRTFVDEVGRRYGAAGHERILVVPGPRYADEATPAGRRIQLAGAALPVARGYRVLTRRHRLLDLLDRLQPDALEVNDRLQLGWVAPWGRARAVPVLVFVHERLDAVLREWAPRWLPADRAVTAVADAANRRLLDRADRLVVGSRFAAAELLRVGGSQVRVVPLGVDLAAFRPAAVPRPAAGRSVQLALVGRLSREKRPERALDTLRLLRSWGVPAGLLVLGDGPLRPRLERAAAGLPVRFLGHVADRGCLARLVAGADVALAPAPHETFGLAVLEALACGTPVVVPATGAARDLVGLLGSGAVTSGTAEGLAQGVLDLLAVPAAERRAAARAQAERFPWSTTVAAMLAAHGAPVPAAPVGTVG